MAASKEGIEVNCTAERQSVRLQPDKSAQLGGQFQLNGYESEERSDTNLEDRQYSSPESFPQHSGGASAPAQFAATLENQSNDDGPSSNSGSSSGNNNKSSSDSSSEDEEKSRNDWIRKSFAGLGGVISDGTSLSDSHDSYESTSSSAQEEHGDVQGSAHQTLFAWGTEAARTSQELASGQCDPEEAPFIDNIEREDGVPEDTAAACTSAVVDVSEPEEQDSEEESGRDSGYSAGKEECLACRPKSSEAMSPTAQANETELNSEDQSTSSSTSSAVTVPQVLSYCSAVLRREMLISAQQEYSVSTMFDFCNMAISDACTRVTDDYPMIRRPQANLPPDVCPVSHSAMFLKETSSAVLTKSSGPPDDDAVAEVLAKAHENSHGSIVEAPSTSKSIANNGQWASSHVFLTQLPSTVHEIASEIDQGDGSDAGIYSEGPPLSSDEDDGEHETSSPNTSSRDYEADAKRDSSTLEAALASSRSAKGASKQKRKTKRVRRQVSSDGAESNGDEGSQERPEFRRGGFPYRDSLKAARTLGQQKQSSMSCAGRENVPGSGATNQKTGALQVNKSVAQDMNSGFTSDTQVAMSQEPAAKGLGEILPVTSDSVDVDECPASYTVRERAGDSATLTLAGVHASLDSHSDFGATYDAKALPTLASFNHTAPMPSANQLMGTGETAKYSLSADGGVETYHPILSTLEKVNTSVQLMASESAVADCPMSVSLDDSCVSEEHFNVFPAVSTTDTCNSVGKTKLVLSPSQVEGNPAPEKSSETSGGEKSMPPEAQMADKEKTYLIVEDNSEEMEGMDVSAPQVLANCRDCSEVQDRTSDGEIPSPIQQVLRVLERNTAGTTPGSPKRLLSEAGPKAPSLSETNQHSNMVIEDHGSDIPEINDAQKSSFSQPRPKKQLPGPATQSAIEAVDRPEHDTALGGAVNGVASAPGKNALLSGVTSQTSAGSMQPPFPQSMGEAKSTAADPPKIVKITCTSASLCRDQLYGSTVSTPAHMKGQPGVPGMKIVPFPAQPAIPCNGSNVVPSQGATAGQGRIQRGIVLRPGNPHLSSSRNSRRFVPYTPKKPGGFIPPSSKVSMAGHLQNGNGSAQQSVNVGSSSRYAADTASLVQCTSPAPSPQQGVLSQLAAKSVHRQHLMSTSASSGMTRFFTNSRERERIREINDHYAELQDVLWNSKRLPGRKRGAMRGRPLRRKVSKLETLQHTINYIMELEEHIKKFHDNDSSAITEDHSADSPSAMQTLNNASQHPNETLFVTSSNQHHPGVAMAVAVPSPRDVPTATPSLNGHRLPSHQQQSMPVIKGAVPHYPLAEIQNVVSNLASRGKNPSRCDDDANFAPPQKRQFVNAPPEFSCSWSNASPRTNAHIVEGQLPNAGAGALANSFMEGGVMPSLATSPGSMYRNHFNPNFRPPDHWSAPVAGVLSVAPINAASSAHLNQQAIQSPPVMNNMPFTLNGCPPYGSQFAGQFLNNSFASSSAVNNVAALGKPRLQNPNQVSGIPCVRHDRRSST